MLPYNYRGELYAGRRGWVGRVEGSGGLRGRNRAVRFRSMPGRQGEGRPK